MYESIDQEEVIVLVNKPLKQLDKRNNNIHILD